MVSKKFTLAVFTIVVAGFGTTWSTQLISLAGQDVSRVPPDWLLIFGLSSALATGLIGRYWTGGKRIAAVLLLLIFVLSLFLSAWLGVEMDFFWVKRF